MIFIQEQICRMNYLKRCVRTVAEMGFLLALIGLAPLAKADDSVLMSLGNKHSCAVVQGVASCWGVGANVGTQDGLDSDFSNPIPTAQTIDPSGTFTNTEVTDIAAGPNHSCLIEGGKVYCWGANSEKAGGYTCPENPPGSGSTPPSCNTIAMAVDDTDDFTNENVTAVAVGERHSCAIADGSAYCWGDSDNNNTGFKNVLGSTSFFSSFAKKVDDTDDFTNENLVAITAGDRHTCVLNAAGEVYCWGQNATAQLGIERSTISSLAVKVVDGPSGDAVRFVNGEIKAITAGNDHTCAINNDDFSFCWGFNGNGQLARNNQTTSHEPKATLTEGEGTFAVTDIAAGEQHTCMIAKDDQFVYCAGSSNRDQNGLSGSSAPPFVNVFRKLNNFKSATGSVNVDQAISIAAGSEHTCVHRAEQLSCWGFNGQGQLGDGGTSPQWRGPRDDYTVLEVQTADPEAVAALVAYDGTQTPPTLAIYEAAGIQNAVEANVAAYNSVLAEIDAADATAVQAMVDAYNAVLAAVADQTLASALTAAQYQALGFILADATGSTSLLNTVIASTDSAVNINTQEKLQGIVATVNGFVDFANSKTGASTPALGDYELLGINGLIEANLGSYNSAVQSKKALTGAAVQAIVSAYNKVLAEAGQGESATVTSEQYEALAVTVTVINGSSETEEPLAGEVLGIVNSAVGIQEKTASDTVVELRRMAKAADGIIQTATDSADAGLGTEDFGVLGIVGVRAGNLAEVVTAVEDATASTLTSVPAIEAVLPDLSDPEAVAALVSFNGQGTAPDATVYEAAGIEGATAANVAAYNSALASVTIAEDDVEAIQSLVTVYNTIISAAGGSTPPTLTVADYAKIGVTVVNAAAADLLNNGVANAAVTDIDTVAEIQAIANAAQGLSTLASSGTGAPSAADYDSVGIQEVISVNVGAYNSGVAEKKASTTDAIQTVVTNYNTVLAHSGNSNSTPPTVNTYNALNVTVPTKALNLMNSGVASQTREASDTVPKLKAMSTAADRIVTTAETSQDAGLTSSDFSVLGIEGTNDSNVPAASDAVAAASVDQVQTVPAVESLLSDVLIPPLPVPTLGVWMLLLMAVLLLLMTRRFVVNHQRQN